MAVRLRAISTGVSRLLVLSRDPLRTVHSAIQKSAVSDLDQPRPVELSLMGLTADEQVDQSVHGGRDKALYAYPVEHWASWSDQFSQAIAPGHFGENLTIEGLTEREVFIGDQWQIGQALLQVTEPRIPCDKFCAVMKNPQAARHMVQTGQCGWYLRVIQVAPIHAGQSIEVRPGPRQETIERAFALKTKRLRQSLPAAPPTGLK